MKLLFTYEEAAIILRYPSYGSLKTAVCRGTIKASRRGRRSYITRDEVLRQLELMGAHGLVESVVSGLMHLDAE